MKSARYTIMRVSTRRRGVEKSEGRQLPTVRACFDAHRLFLITPPPSCSTVHHHAHTCSPAVTSPRGALCGTRARCG